MRTSSVLRTVIAALALTLIAAPGAGAADGVAPGHPGASANWTTGDKQGLGTSTTRESKVWYTLSDGAMSEVYFPRGDLANVRSLEFAVTDGTSFVDRESGTRRTRSGWRTSARSRTSRSTRRSPAATGSRSAT